MARGPLPGRSIKSPEHYRKAKPATQRHRNGFDKLAPSSKFTYGGTLRKLQQYCAYIGDPLEPLNPPDFLKTATADAFCNFMEWSLNNSAIMKLDVAMNAFTRLQSLYKFEAGHEMDSVTSQTVRDFIENDMQRACNLVRGISRRPPMGTDDLEYVVKYLWSTDVHRYSLERKRVQLFCFALLAAFTSERPGTIVESSAGGIRGTGEALLYKDIELLKWRNSKPGGAEFRFSVRTNFHFKKGLRYKGEPTIHPLHEDPNDHLSMCPMIPLVAIALADDAFKGGYKTAEEVYSVPVAFTKEMEHLQWKDCVLNKPFFRRIENGEVTDKACPYACMSDHWRQLIHDSGHPDPVPLYSLRIGCGNALNVSGASESIRNQIMGHKSHRIFEKHYRTAEVRWDVQSTYRGAVQQKDLVLATGNKLLLRDSRAPIKLTEEREIEILKHPSVMALQDAIQCLLKQCQNEYGSLKKARLEEPDGAALWRAHCNADKKVKTQKRNLRQEALKGQRVTWFSTHHDDSDDPVPLPVRLSLPERAALAEILWKEAYTGKDDVHTDRLLDINLMSQLCSEQEPLNKMAYTPAAKRLASGQMRGLYPMQCRPKTCLFCLNKNRGDRALSTRARLSRHLEKTHYPRLTRGKPFECPHPSCHTTLQHIHHFQTHALRVHGIEFNKKCGQAVQSKWGNILKI